MAVLNSENLTIKWPQKVIQGHVFSDRWKGDKGLDNTI